MDFNDRHVLPVSRAELIDYMKCTSVAFRHASFVPVCQYPVEFMPENGEQGMLARLTNDGRVISVERRFRLKDS